MASVDTNWIYWEAAFPAIIFNTIGADASFTISNLLITSSFPADTQALAGGVFKTISQLGNAVEMTLAILIAETVTDQADKSVREGDQKQLRARMRVCAYEGISSCLLVLSWYVDNGVVCERCRVASGWRSWLGK